MQVKVQDIVRGDGGVYAVVAYTSGKDYMLPFYMPAGSSDVSNYLKEAKFRVLDAAKENINVRFVTVRLYKLYDMKSLGVVFKSYGVNIAVFMRVLNMFVGTLSEFFNMNIISGECDYADVTDYFNK